MRFATGAGTSCCAGLLVSFTSSWLHACFPLPPHAWVPESDACSFTSMQLCAENEAEDFLLSSYDASVSLAPASAAALRRADCSQPLLWTARYLPMGRMAAVEEAGVPAERLRPPPPGSSPWEVFGNGCAFELLQRCCCCSIQAPLIAAGLPPQLPVLLHSGARLLASWARTCNRPLSLPAGLRPRRGLRWARRWKCSGRAAAPTHLAGGLAQCRAPEATVSCSCSGARWRWWRLAGLGLAPVCIRS